MIKITTKRGYLIKIKINNRINVFEVYININ